MRHHVQLLLVSVVFGAVVIAPSAGATIAPSALYSSILVAGEEQHSVHYVSVQTSGPDRIVEVADAARTEGIQRITYTQGGQTGKVTVLVTPASAYVRGDAFALAKYMGYAEAASVVYSERWIQIPVTDPDYAPVSTDVTMPEAVEVYVPAPVWSSSSAPIQGQAVVGVSGSRPATAKSPALSITLWARATGTPLPLTQEITKGLYSATVTFTRWNEPLRISAPSDATPIGSTGLESGAAKSNCGCAS